MKKLNYNIMNFIWIILFVTSCNLFILKTSEDFVRHYQVSSGVLDDIVNSTRDSCQARLGCNEIEYLYIKIDTTSDLLIQVKTLRKNLNEQVPILQKNKANVVSFYIGKTLCFADNYVLKTPEIFDTTAQLEPIDLSGFSFKYKCLDLNHNEDIYNTLITFDFMLNSKEEVILKHQSIFIDAGDVDISDALKKRGIKEK